LTSGLTDLALGVVAEAAIPGIQMRPLGVQRFVFVVAPHHPLAKTPEPLGDQTIFSTESWQSQIRCNVAVE